ncbi:MAG TPA: sulfate adenylyltransferase subunit CysD [Segeticoccus sp.]|uniref:sulfate adenylyltransferase subunit CysD n=1 Tax=Segeticoccus sp. TaxID=2706531 RepID=UPI002D806F56|nr:sulfate adenylyltransferase subunit CysD [Segeticoccus sp.]HET8600723.1 sulfate adenylyltransferase subunit CysD [Segeticoccus sp.]
MSIDVEPDVIPATGATNYRLTQLQALEAEAIFIFREVVAELERPVLLFSGGKDSLVMLRLAEKAFRPGRIPFPVLHVDTGHNFEEVLAVRDARAAELGLQLIVASVQEAIDNGSVHQLPDGTRNRSQIPVLLAALEKYQFTAVFGGARRDEDKARAKERIYSFRDEFGQWDPKNQRPELWSLYNGRIHPGESIRVFPLSNWTELDIWHYIGQERITLPSIYYAHERPVFQRDGMLFGVHEVCQPRAEERVEVRRVRYRTVGDASLTAAVESDADTIERIIAEVSAARVTERGATRGDDRFSDSAMEDRKREGYF